MNKLKYYGGLFFLHILIPIGITLLSKWIIGFNTAEIVKSGVQISQDTEAYQLMISSQADIFQWVISVFIGVLSSFFIASRETKTNIDIFKSDIQNKLVKTNAIITNPETKKIAITAQELDFYERKIYEEIEKYTDDEKQSAMSIDVLRWYSLQDLLFSPKYLNYFFNRGNQVGTPIRIIVIEKVCLATITFLFLNLKANYKTYIISNTKFKKFYSRQKTSLQKILKGNPYIIKIQNSVKYGKYSNYEDKPTTISNKDELWTVCNNLISKSEEINNTRDTFSIKDIEYLLNGE